MLTEISRRLLEWYSIEARRLPWRGVSDPYRVWVSEIMLQQTRVETVIPYFNHWVEKFPTLADMALAEEQDVLHAWEGLGYYSRARNLHKAARQVMADYGGELPSDPARLQRLPGIGRYTAAAIASIAFGCNTAALDGNIRRVLTRIFDVQLDARSPDGEKVLWTLAQENLPDGKAGDYNQALMDLGATICTPRSPECGHCPLQSVCQAHGLGVEEQRPVMKASKPVPHITVTAAVIRRNGAVLIARRPSSGLLGGMWEFPGGKVEAGEDLSTGLRREIREELATEIEVGLELGVYQHAYTHFRLTLHAFECLLTGSEPQAVAASALCWVEPSGLKDFPMGKVDRQISRQLCIQDGSGRTTLGG